MPRTSGAPRKSPSSRAWAAWTRDAEGWQELVAASGPDCLSGGQWEMAYAYEAYCCVRGDGELVQLCRDARRNRWEVHGVWR